MKSLFRLLTLSALMITGSQAWSLPLGLQWGMNQAQVSALLGPPTSAPAPIMTESASYTLLYDSLPYDGLSMKATLEGHPNLFYVDLEASLPASSLDPGSAQALFKSLVDRLQADTGLTLSPDWSSGPGIGRGSANGADSGQSLSLSLYPSSDGQTVRVSININHF